MCRSLKIFFSDVGGTQHSKNKAKTASECLGCPEGKYCPAVGDKRPIVCPKGFYCEAEQTSGFQHPCPRGMTPSLWRLLYGPFFMAPSLIAVLSLVNFGK
jgi:hypothetical protein